MKKRWLGLFLLAFGMFALAACSESALTVVTIEGIADVTIDYDSEFNVFTGITAVGDDGKDYTDLIEVTSVCTISATGELNTLDPRVCFIRYSVTVGDIFVARNRYITISDPIRDSLVLNGDFSMGTVGWDTFSDGGASITLTPEDGALRIDVVAGANTWEPRISQMGIAFENDTVYEVSFRAKSSVVGKQIHLQVGEILPNDPWFTDFKPRQLEYVTLTDEWATYSYKFTHRMDNDRGGLLFEFGNFQGQRINATIWLDDVTVVESTLGDDTLPPVFSGLPQQEITVLVNQTFNPLQGVTAFDVVDGDVTADIVVTIKDLANNEVVTAIDTSKEGSFEVHYAVADAAGNEAEFTLLVHVSAMTFTLTDAISNGNFAEGLEGWSVWSQDWDDAPTVSYEVVDGVFELTTDKPGMAAWAIQVNQAGVMVEQGKTYKVSFDAKATVARDMNAVLLIPGEGAVIYHRQDSIMLTTEMATYEFMFTVTHPSALVQLSLELGGTPAFAAGTVSFDNVKLSVADLDDFIYNRNFDITGWRSFAADWDGNFAHLTVENGQGILNVTQIGDLSENWKLQVIQDAYALGTGVDNQGSFVFEAGKSYRLAFDAKASVAGTINVAIGRGLGGWMGYYTELVAITTDMDSYHVDFTLSAEGDYSALAQVKFEVGTVFAGQTAPQTFTYDNVVLYELVEADYVNTNQVVNGTLDQVVGWNLFQMGGEGTMQVTEDGLEIDVTAIGGEAWQIHLHNGETSTLTQGSYVFTLTLEASVARTISANITVPSQEFRSVLPGTVWIINVTEDVVQYTLAFDLPEDLLGIAKIELSLGNLGGEHVSVPSVITIHDINLFKVY